MDNSKEKDKLKNLGKAGAVAVVTPMLVVLVGFMTSHSLCACISLEHLWRNSIGVSPRSDPKEFSESLLKVLRPGSTMDDIYLTLYAASSGGKLTPEGLENMRKREHSVDAGVQEMYLKGMDRFKRKCKSIPGELKCHFVLEKNWFNYNEVGFDLHVALDGADRLKGLSMSPFSIWGGSET